MPITRRPIALAALLALFLAGCRPTPPASAEASIRISGAWALYPLVVKWAEEYRALNPQARIDVSAGGAGKGAADALGGLVDIGMVSRSIHKEELAKGGWFVPVARDAVFPMVSAGNPALQDLQTHGARREALASLWVKGEPLTWGAVAGIANADPVHLYTRSDACGAGETWAAYLGAKQEDLQGTAVYGDPGLAETVRKDPLGLGYNNLGYAYDVRTGKPVPGITVLPLDLNADGKLGPDEQFYGSVQDLLRAIGENRYPSPPARDLNFLCKGRPSGAVARFVRWCLTDGQKLAPATGFIPLPPDKSKQALADLGG
jgi:phosphate transport system substrate-binding protein